MEDVNQFLREARIACDELMQLEAGHGIKECQTAKRKCLIALNRAIEELQDLKSGLYVGHDGSDEQDRAIQRVTDQLTELYSEKGKADNWTCDYHK